jgi:ABC-type glycerol-3-phosphate transport system substrate-binding protein
MLALTGGAGAVALAACAGPQAAAPAAGPSTAPVTVQYFKRGTLPDGSVEALMTDWTARHPTWKVDVVQGVTDEKLAAHIAADDKMDALTYNYAARTMILAYNLLRPIDGFVSKDRYNVAKFSAN